MSSITFTNGVINLEDLQYEMNRNVKNYMIDTPNWSVAASNLKYLLSQTASFFYDFIKSGERPTPNQYWFVFANLSSQLCFNYGAALYNQLSEDNVFSKEFEKVENALITAAMVMPNSNEQEYIEYLQMIEGTYVQSLLKQGTVTQMSLVEFVLSKNNNLDQNLINFFTNIRDNYIPS
ncbi:hypothetical protein CVD25_15270 [Bacillus canaveralius]|uniref:Uncharacterized protein n=1 Tax=Bacillus canaveralius TaxID=1403243 RepID=A0A2N5GK66_9BACI|nr:hypothetical protein [Bacillus canaveralius]PLR81829.1 hypothetical protein CU635_13795 [Bacillus canaveralius]PLR94983.1 hypothetical protein CVD25_15270 [Bacillus canaveralius]